MNFKKSIEVIPELHTNEKKERFNEIFNMLIIFSSYFRFHLNIDQNGNPLVKNIFHSKDIVTKTIYFLLYMEHLTKTRIDITSFPIDNFIQKVYEDCYGHSINNKPQETKEEFESYLLDLYNTFVVDMST